MATGPSGGVCPAISAEAPRRTWIRVGAPARRKASTVATTTTIHAVEPTAQKMPGSPMIGLRAKSSTSRAATVALGGGEAVPTIANLPFLGKLLGVPYVPLTPYLLPLPLPISSELRSRSVRGRSRWKASWPMRDQ